MNWRETRRKRKEMQQYQTPSHDFVYFRPVEGKDLHAIQKLEVPNIMVATSASSTRCVALGLSVAHELTLKLVNSCEQLTFLLLATAKSFQ